MILSAWISLFLTVACSSAADERLKVSNAAVSSKLNDLRKATGGNEADLNRRTLEGDFYRRTLEGDFYRRELEGDFYRREMQEQENPRSREIPRIRMLEQEFARRTLEQEFARRTLEDDSNRRSLFGIIYPWGNIDNSCGSNGNNRGRELLRKQAYSSCLCKEECEKNDQCAGWTYIPTGIFGDMHNNDCVLRSTWGNMIDNCGGRCLSAARTNPVCTLADCNNNAVSVSGNRGTGCQCTCSSGWAGERCDRKARCACENGGTAATGSACVKDGFQCASCPPGKRGKFCHEEWVDPEPAVCANEGATCVCTGKAYHAERCKCGSMWWSDCQELTFAQIERGGCNEGSFYREKPVTGSIHCTPKNFGFNIIGWSGTDKRCWCDNDPTYRQIAGVYPGTQVPVSICGAEVDQNDKIGQQMLAYGISGIADCGAAANYCESYTVQSICPYTCGRCKAAVAHFDIQNPLNNIGLDFGFAGSGFWGR